MTFVPPEGFELYRLEDLHRDVLKETFEQVTFKEAVALVGFLWKHQIQYSEELQHLLQKVHGRSLETHETMEPEAGAELVAKCFDLGPEELRKGFRDQWDTVQQSPLMEEIRVRIAEHRFVAGFWIRKAWA